MVLIIDHYDSFVDMIGDYIAALGFQYHLIKTDSIYLDNIDIRNYSHIIIGPGPGHPSDKSLNLVYPIIKRAIKHDIPLLGICLGHQMIAQFFGTEITTATRICHGVIEKIKIVGTSLLFTQLPMSFNVTRYHSLIIKEINHNTQLIITAFSEQNEIMAFEHKLYKIYGVQFHPESIMTEHGHAMFANFLRIT